MARLAPWREYYEIERRLFSDRVKLDIRLEHRRHPEEARRGARTAGLLDWYEREVTVTQETEEEK